MSDVAPQQDAFPLFYIVERALSLFLRSHLLPGHPTSGNGHETDQCLGGISTHPHPLFRIPIQDLNQFLVRDAFVEQPSFAGENGTPSYPVSWLIPPAELYQFLQPFAVLSSELPSSDNGYEIPAEHDMPADAPLLLVPEESLSQFLQVHEIPPVPSSFDSEHEIPVVQQLEDGSESSESDPASRSVTPTQSQDSEDEADAQPDEATSPILHGCPGCPVCRDTFDRVQERNRHVESYLPHSILCPSQGCTWTGRRQWDFKMQHWKKKHAEAGQAPGEGAKEIYDPKDFVKLIVDGNPVDQVARYAFAKVRESLGRLGRLDVLANVLGRNRDLKKWIRNP